MPWGDTASLSRRTLSANKNLLANYRQFNTWNTPLRSRTTEEQAIVESIQYEVLEGDMSKWGSMRKVQQSCAHFRILIDPETRIILGAHLLGPPAAEQINLFAMAMKFGISAPQMKSVLFTFPSFTADIRSML